MNSSCSYESVKLIIEGKPLVCDKKLLTTHSEYFERILGPNEFIESGTKELEIKGVEYSTMEIVLKLTGDPSYFIGEENILMVLVTADMLQFTKILEMCIMQTTELMSIHTCVKIWFMTEHIHSRFGCVPIYLKAKFLALFEFEFIKDTAYLMDLNLNQICSYLGNAQLKCNKEIEVFQVFMRWWYDNCRNNDKILVDTAKNFTCMLFCLDFNALSVFDINEMLAYPDVNQNPLITDYLNCVIHLKNKGATESYSDEVVQIAKRLLNANKRTRKVEPYLHTTVVKLKPKINPKGNKVVDKCKRKRALYDGAISNYDILQETIGHFLVLPDNKANVLEGCQMVGYKGYIFFFGGEFGLGRGDWNRDFWVYDTIKEIWSRKTRLPGGRRHFQCCIINSKVFMIGGTGIYRVLQNDMLFYDYKTDIWSKPIELPNNSGCLKSCVFLGQLLLVDSGVRVSYLFDDKTLTFGKILFEMKSLPFKYSVFAIADRLFIKGAELLEFKIFNGRFILQETFRIESQNLLKCDRFNSVLCSNDLFTLYMDGNNVVLEKFDMITKQSFLLLNVNIFEEEEQRNGTFLFHYTDLFAFSRFELIKQDCYINTFNEYIKSAES